MIKATPLDIFPISSWKGMSTTLEYELHVNQRKFSKNLHTCVIIVLQIQDSLTDCYDSGLTIL